MSAEANRQISADLIKGAAPEQPTKTRPGRVSDERVASIIDLLGFRPDLFTERQKLAIEARDSRAREAKQAEEIARLTAALAEAQAQAGRARNVALEEAAESLEGPAMGYRVGKYRDVRTARMLEHFAGNIRSLKTEPRP